MFNDRISNPISPLTINYVNEFINRINGEPDYALTSLAYALFKPRFQKYDGIYGRIGIQGTVDDQLNDAKLIMKERRSMTEEELKRTPCLRYYILFNKNDYPTITEALKESGMQELPQIKAYMSQELKLESFAAMINKDLNYACVFVPTPHIEIYHLVIAFLGALFPLSFEDKPLTKDEINILKALTNKTSAKFVSLVSTALNTVKKDVLKFELHQCFSGFREQKISQAHQNVLNLERQIEETMQMYQNYMERLESAVVMYEGMKAVNGDDGNNQQETETIEYIAGCPRLHNVEYHNGELTFDVDTLLTNFDMLKWRNVVSRRDIFNNYRLEPNNPFSNVECRKKLLNTLFDTNDPELCVKMRGRFHLKINRNYMDVERGTGYTYFGTEMDNCLTNPHFELHGCPGENRNQVIECLKNADIISAIECCIAATGSVNIGETELTFRPFVQNILTSNKKIIHRMSDGVDLTPAEALMWLMMKEGDKVA